jgi:hypothetical protein
VRFGVVYNIVEKNKHSKLWNCVNRFFNIALDILFGPVALPLAKYFLLRSYTSLIEYVCNGSCGKPLFLV